MHFWKELRSALKNYIQIPSFMAHASVTNYAQAFIRAQRGKLDKEKQALLDRLLAMMKENGDEKKILITLRSILKLLSHEEKKTARIVTAVQLSARQKETIEKQFLSLRDIFRRETDYTFEWEVNPAILGGFMVEQGTRLYQMTVRHLLKGFER